MARFTSVDPIRVNPARLRVPQALNLYSYVQSNPIKFFDPSGMDQRIYNEKADEAGFYRNLVEEEEPEKGGAPPPASAVGMVSPSEGFVDDSGPSPWAIGLAAIGVLVADDATGVGVVDDGAIPFIAIGTMAADLSTRTYITYTLRNAAGQVYVGRASGFGHPLGVLQRRFAGHHMRALGFADPRLDRVAYGVLYRAAIRGREQQVIDSYGGVGSPRVGNRIRGVAKWNPNGRIYHAASNALWGNLHDYTGY